MIVVIGAGWAGCAAAVTLAQAGRSVQLHEAAATLGGRARCVVRDGLPLDNGEHLLLGAYADTLALARAIRDDDSPPAWTIEPLSLQPYAATQPDALSLTTARWPASLGLLTALLRARGLGVGERLATLGWFVRRQRDAWRCDGRLTVDELLANLPIAVRDKLLNPLCLAALNTPPDRASAQVFLNVLRETFGAGARGTSIVVPREGLGEAIPEATARWLGSQSHAVRRSTRSRIRGADTGGVELEAAGQPMRAEAVVVAVGPHQLTAAFAPGPAASAPGIAAALTDVARFDYEPITTAYLGYASTLALPPGLLRLAGMPGQWIFDRADILERATPSSARPAMRALVSVVISARGPHTALDHRALAGAIDAQLRRLAPALPALAWSRVIEEKRATYACVPGLARPPCGRLAPRIYLAGDYTYDAFPATLEAAVRSGRLAAQALLRELPA